MSIMELPRWHSCKESICQCRRPGFDPWVRKIPWTRKWQPAPVFLPVEFRGQEPGRLQSTGSQRARHDLATEQQQPGEEASSPSSVSLAPKVWPACSTSTSAGEGLEVLLEARDELLWAEESRPPLRQRPVRPLLHAQHLFKPSSTRPMTRESWSPASCLQLRRPLSEPANPA